jgi:crotonobetainyl-CoA:carnitine CoA-transferase CaiB-like acyl-CoA transferase
MSDEAGPLDGLVVVDLSTNLTSAYTTMLFADYGAEVISVERPGGSPLRRMSAWPFWLRGKKSITLDLTRPADVEVARSLAAGSDVVVEAFGAGGADRLGLGYEALRSTNPGLVYTSISGFGHSGPYAHLKGYEAVVMAKSGSMYGPTAPNRPGPVMLNPLGASFSAALLAAHGALVALHERQRSGHGQRVDATMVQGMLAQDPWFYVIAFIAARYPEAFSFAGGAPSTGRPVPSSWLAFGLLNGYTANGDWLQFAHATPKQFDAFVRALDLEYTRNSDPEMKGAPDSEDTAIRDRFWTMMIEKVRQRTTAEWQAVFDRDKDVFAERYLRGDELFEHPQVVHDHHVVEVEHPGIGTVRQMDVLVKMSKTPGQATRPLPAVNQHGDELRARPAPPRPTSGPGVPAPEGVPPLQGVTVVDLGTFYAGPFGSAMLADQGARVIKVEPLEGDPIRFVMPIPEAGGVRVTQGKESIAVDLFSEEGKAIVTELLRRADLVLHSYRGGVAERMGLDASSAMEINPDLVYHHGVGYGIDGPYARRSAYAPTIAAASGFATRSGGGGPGGGDLTVDQIKDASLTMAGAQSGHPDGMAALGVAVAMSLGLVARDRGAGGQVTMTSMLSTMGHALADGLVEYDGASLPPMPDDDQYGYDALYRLYASSDGWIVLCAPEEHHWPALVASLPDASGLVGDDRFATAASRREHDAELIELLTGIFATGAAADWEKRLSQAGVGCAEVAPNSGMLAIGMFAAGGVADQLGMLTTVKHPVFDEHARTTAMVTLSRSGEALGAGCTIGQHTDAILHELGYDDERIAELRAKGVIGG